MRRVHSDEEGSVPRGGYALFFCVKGKKEKPGKFVRIFFFDQLRQ